jgi:hypothetical protein
MQNYKNYSNEEKVEVEVVTTESFSFANFKTWISDTYKKIKAFISSFITNLKTAFSGKMVNDAIKKANRNLKIQFNLFESRQREAVTDDELVKVLSGKLKLMRNEIIRTSESIAKSVETITSIRIKFEEPLKVDETMIGKMRPVDYRHTYFSLVALYVIQEIIKDIASKETLDDLLNFEKEATFGNTKLPLVKVYGEFVNDKYYEVIMYQSTNTISKESTVPMVGISFTKPKSDDIDNSKKEKKNTNTPRLIPYFYVISDKSLSQYNPNDDSQNKLKNFTYTKIQLRTKEQGRFVVAMQGFISYNSFNNIFPSK